MESYLGLVEDVRRGRSREHVQRCRPARSRAGAALARAETSSGSSSRSAKNTERGLSSTAGTRSHHARSGERPAVRRRSPRPRLERSRTLSRTILVIALELACPRRFPRPACGSAKTRPAGSSAANAGQRSAQTCPSMWNVECAVGEVLRGMRHGAGATISQPAGPRELRQRAERRLVCPLRGLVGFTAASAERDAEDTRELLSRYFETAPAV